MAAINFASLAVWQPELSFTKTTPRKTITVAKKRPFYTFNATASAPESITSPSEKPQIELQFIGPKPVEDGKYPVDKASAVSREKLLRNIMSDNKLELYGAYIIDGKDLLNERTNTELRYLKKAQSTF